jgi:hypothetical protein
VYTLTPAAAGEAGERDAAVVVDGGQLHCFGSILRTA